MKRDYHRAFLTILIIFTPFVLGLVLNQNDSGLVFPKLSTQFNLRSEGQRVLEVRIDPKLLPLLQKESSALEKELQKRFPLRIPLKLSFPNQNSFFKMALPLPRENLLVREHLFFKDYIFKEKVNLKYESALSELRKEIPPDLEPILKTVKLTYELKLPGKVIKANATRIWPDKAEWQLSLGKIYEVRAQSQVIRWHLIIFTGILVLILVGIVGAEIIKHPFPSREKEEK